MLSTPQHLSHIYDTPDIYVWVLGVECWGGSYKKWGKKIFTDSKLNVEHPQHLSHIYDTLDIYVWVLGGGGGWWGGL